MAKTLPLWVILIGALTWTDDALAYRPFDFTDAAVADFGEFELELGPVEFETQGSEQTLIAPATVFNYGFAKNWEVVLEGQLEHPEDGPSRLLENSLTLKHVLREGVLQDQSGPSIATEFGVLLPDDDEPSRAGATWAAIVSQRWPWGTIHFNGEAELTLEQHFEMAVGAIIEGPYNWKVRPVAEIGFEREFATTHKLFGLIGAIWNVRENLELDFGVHEAWVDVEPSITEVRAGLTYTFSLTDQRAAKR